MTGQQNFTIIFRKSSQKTPKNSKFLRGSENKSWISGGFSELQPLETSKKVLINAVALQKMKLVLVFRCVM